MRACACFRHPPGKRSKRDSRTARAVPRASSADAPAPSDDAAACAMRVKTVWMVADIIDADTCRRRALDSVPPLSDAFSPTRYASWMM